MSQELKQAIKTRVPEDGIEVVSYSEGGYMTIHYQGKPFSGYLVMDYHTNGNIMFEEEYKEGEHLGWDNEYHENGQLKDSTLMVGATVLTFYEFDENGIEQEGGGKKQVSDSVFSELVEKYKLSD